MQNPDYYTADVDHIQGLAKAKQTLKTTVSCHTNAVKRH